MSYEFNGLQTYGNIILFYNNQIPDNYWLSNFFPCSLIYNNNTFTNSDSLFQSLKFEHIPNFHTKFTNLDAGESFKVARFNKVRCINGWISDGLNVDAMAKTLNIKFSQNSNLGDQLVETGSAYLLEHCPPRRDVFWADNGNGTGKNMLGQLLMKQRGNIGGVGVVVPSQNSLNTVYNSSLWNRQY
jgi:predicted NAD-dependent protein-ADP-ribosyltransferase YbiA (DUF1768 family)